MFNKLPYLLVFSIFLTAPFSAIAASCEVEGIDFEYCSQDFDTVVYADGCEKECNQYLVKLSKNLYVQLDKNNGSLSNKTFNGSNKISNISDTDSTQLITDTNTKSTNTIYESSIILEGHTPNMIFEGHTPDM